MVDGLIFAMQYAITDKVSYWSCQKLKSKTCWNSRKVKVWSNSVWRDTLRNIVLLLATKGTLFNVWDVLYMFEDMNSYGLL